MSDTPYVLKLYPHSYVPGEGEDEGYCGYRDWPEGNDDVPCGYPKRDHVRPEAASLIKAADVAQYSREPMPDAARKGIQVTLIDAPTDPLGTLAVLSGIYEGKVFRSKGEVTDDQRRDAWEAMRATVLSGPLESIQFTFLVEGVGRDITHQMVRNRFSFFAQESLRFAVAEDWAQEVPLPPSLAGMADDAPAVRVWQRGLNAAEDAYAALVAAGMPAEEARGLLPHAITTRLYWTVSLRTLLTEAGKRTCTQAQFPWRILFGDVAKAFREQPGQAYITREGSLGEVTVRDGWQFDLFAAAIRPVCYQEGKCGFMAKFDRGCTIRGRVEANADRGRPSSEWGTELDEVDPTEIVSGLGPHTVVRTEEGRPVFIPAIKDREWAADPAAARVWEKPEYLGEDPDFVWYCAAGVEVMFVNVRNQWVHAGSSHECTHGGQHQAPAAPPNTKPAVCRCGRRDDPHAVGDPGCRWEGQSAPDGLEP